MLVRLLQVQRRHSPVSLPKAAVINECDPILQKTEYFKQLNSLLRSGEDLSDIKKIPYKDISMRVKNYANRA